MRAAILRSARAVPASRRSFTASSVPNALSNRLAATTRSPEELEALGARFARRCQPGDVLFLHGDLGCGKTCFARGFVREHVGDAALAVTSPTYLLVNSYEVPTERYQLFHIDLYRLDAVSSQDAAALGLEDAFANGITLVEWPERLDAAIAPRDRLNVHISYDEQDPTLRHVRFDPVGPRWTAALNEPSQ